MSFATFGDLKDRIMTDCLRTDQAFLNELPGFVALAEQRMFYGEPRVFARSMKVSQALTFTAGAATLPERFLEPIALTWGEYAPGFSLSEEFWRQPVETAIAPTLYTIEGEQVLIRPSMAGDARLVFLQRPAPLVADADTNWFLANAPAVYFHAIMFEVWRHLRNTAKMNESAGLYISNVAGLALNESRSLFTGTSLNRASAFA